MYDLLADGVGVLLVDFSLDETEVVELRLEQFGGSLFGSLRPAAGLHENAEVVEVTLILFNALSLLEFCADYVLNFVFCFLECELRGLDDLDLDELVEVSVSKLGDEDEFDVALVGVAFGCIGKPVFKLVDLEVWVSCCEVGEDSCSLFGSIADD